MIAKNKKCMIRELPLLSLNISHIKDSIKKNILYNVRVDIKLKARGEKNKKYTITFVTSNHEITMLALELYPTINPDRSPYPKFSVFYDYPLEICVQREHIVKAVGHHAPLLVLADLLLEEVRFAFQRDELHEAERVLGVVDLLIAEFQK